MNAGDLETLKDFLLERMEPMDAWLVLSAAKHPDAARVLIDRPIDHSYCVCGAHEYDYDIYGDRPDISSHARTCPVVLALQALNHPALVGVVEHEWYRAEEMYQDHRESQLTNGIPEHWIAIDTETIDEHERRRGALLHPSVIAARRAGAEQEDIDDIIESIIQQRTREDELP